MAGDEEMVSYLQKLLGYGITGEISEEIFVLFNGTGRNGKGVITQTLQNILGEDFVKEVGLICGDDRSLSNSSMAKLGGSRIALFKESNEDEVLKTNVVQLLTGGDRIPCRDVYASADDLLPGESWTPLVQPVDKTLKGRLKDMRCSFLTWLVQGSIVWYRDRNLKSSPPSAVKEFTRQYMLAEDLIAQFIETTCTIGPYNRISSNELVEYYNEWLRHTTNTRKRIDNRGMATLMNRKGFYKKSTRVNGVPTKGYEGIRVDEYRFRVSLK
ncbi:hypothetical protein CEUSTIGMA_g13286.t1 [Chlamydomonas eustigma]|uniref:SF3 helicase domain-containing protein n=1 Tax=Chlamydomonas eustigma TaxID=1157962 RepID=A0A250XST8_9CHLO|nr:hypothetical protein CEUSTIGMA_g13286.t1 [Chlamydomonas eustigma]|eukprot:GAX85870.1 hypothetical protein CEUSTIGMA_g13286.t1 [Chlamydomonas eustigma]